jgi:hypothetical protein
MTIISTNRPLNQPIIFQATWNNNNRHLEESLIEKMTRCVFCILNHFAITLVLPASRRSQAILDDIKEEFERKWQTPLSSREKLLKHQFDPFPIEVTTPDGVKIQGTFFKNKAAIETSATVVFFQPNALSAKQGAFDWVMQQAALQEFQYNFVYFDYRGCDGKTHKPRSAKDLYLDGDSVYQFVKDKLRVNPAQIHFYGWSLGGGVSSHIKQINKECEGRYVNERSFTTINDTLKNVVNRVFAFASGLLTSLLNWNMDSAKAIENLKGKTLIVHHPEDELMQKKASLYNHFFAPESTAAAPEISHLDLSRSPSKPHFIHGAPLERFVADGFNPEAEIAQFLFGSNLTQKQRMIQIFRNSPEEFRNQVYQKVATLYQKERSYWGSGADACHNRNGLSLTESQLANAVIAAKQIPSP